MNKQKYDVYIDDTTKRKLALQNALDIRKFEIELYWKRATYFWGFLIVIFTGYFTVLFNVQTQFKGETLLLISCLGTLFSIGWFLVNKGSKFWQNNWERHVDYLEDEFMGPLYKLVISENQPKLKWYDLYHYSKRLIVSEGHYSVSKINQALSFFVLTIWLFLGAGNAIKLIHPANIKIRSFDITYHHVYFCFMVYSLIYSIYMWITCKTTKFDSPPSLEVNERLINK